MSPRPRGRRGTPQGRLEQVEFGPNLPCFRGFASASVAQTIDTGIGNEEALQFDCWENGNDNVFDYSVSGSPAMLDSVNALIEGVYLINFVFDFTATLADGDKVAWCPEEGGMDFGSPTVILPAQPKAGDNSSGMYSFSVTRGYPPVWMRCIDSTCALAPCLPTWRMNVAQISGSTRTIQNAMFEIYLIGGLSVDTSELGP